MQHVDEVLKNVVEQTQRSAGLMGLGAVVIRAGDVIGLSVSGIRKKGSARAVTTEDLWHIGSITKSFTATMMARLVERGALDWLAPLKTFFSEGDIHAQYQDVTLEQLLTHTSGLPANFPIGLMLKAAPAPGADRMLAREFAVNAILTKAPKATPGSRFVYSNVGYTVAGVIAEKATGLAWETLIEQEIFTPLSLCSGGFGVPRDAADELGQPWGHKKLFGFRLASQADNTPVIGPAGTVHLSLSDLAAYGEQHLVGLKNQSAYLSAESFARLHQVKLNDYALGWMTKAPRDLGLGGVHWHNGSNTLWYAMLVLLPDIDAVVAITSNDGSLRAAEKGAWNIIEVIAKSLRVL
ncbi:MAG TPA: serine hydrolase domain-containing protein [Marinagarivorans sp.]